MNRNKIIVVIEDEPSLLMAIDFKLKKIGYEVFSATTGEEGLELIKQKHPCLIWSDFLLSGISGLELFRRARKEPGMENVPFVIVSVSAGSEKIKESLSLGVADYIVKSDFSLDEIIEKIVKLIQTYETK